MSRPSTSEGPRAVQAPPRVGIADPDARAEELERRMDEALTASFPASDPPAWSSLARRGSE